MPISKRLRFLVLLSFLSLISAYGDELNTQLKPELPEDRDEAPAVFKDMGVIQNKAIVKSNDILIAPNFSMDFSDGPKAMYGFNLGLGYAFNDFFEVYLATTPYFYTFDRDIVKKIESLELKNGGRATVLAPRAKYQMGGEILWSPLYGKDSVGLKSIIRSDTFLKFGVHNIWYSKGEGLRFHLGLGKTFFLTQWLGARLTLSANYYQKIWNEVKSWSTITMVEFGTVIYF